MYKIELVHNSNGETRPQRVRLAGLILGNNLRPDELEDPDRNTPSKEIFELLQDATLRRKNRTRRADGSPIDYNGAILNLNDRLETSPTATAQIILALTDKFPWLRNEHTKPIIRKALATLRTKTTTSKPAPTAADIQIPITPIEIDAEHPDACWIPTASGANVKIWPTVQAVTTNQQILAEFTNGLIFNWRAVALKKNGWRDEPITNLDDAIHRFELLLANPPAGLLARLNLVRRAIDSGMPVHLVVDDRLVRMAIAVADAIKRLPPTPQTAPAAKGEYGVLPALFQRVIRTIEVLPNGHTRMRPIVKERLPNNKLRVAGIQAKYAVRIGIDTEEEDFHNREPVADPAPLRFRRWVENPETGLHRPLQVLLHKNRAVIPNKDQVCRVQTQQSTWICTESIQIQMTRSLIVLGIRAKIYDPIAKHDADVVYYMQPGSAEYWPNEDETGNTGAHDGWRIARRTISTNTEWVEPAWDIIEGLTGTEWQRHPFFPIAATLTARAQADHAKAIAQNWEAEVFHHRTLRAGSGAGLHEEEDNMRFDQHDDGIFQRSPMEELEHRLAAVGGDSTALDYAMNDPDIDPETAAWLAEEADPAARAAADQASRPTWWRKTVDARNLPGRKVKIMEDGTVTSVVLDATGKHRYGNHVLISHCTGTPNTIFAHLHKINVSVGQRVKAGTVIGEGEPPLLLPAEFAATTAAVRDCKIKRFTPEGRPIEGWIVPVNYQLAGIHQRIHVMHEGKVLPRDAQRRLNGGECWEYIAVTSAPIANLPKLEPQPFKKNAIVRPPLHERIAAYDTPMPKLPTHRCFNPGDPAWHEPLRDDDTQHLIVTLNDSEHALAKLVADLIA